MMMQHYRIYVRLKSGGQATGRELHTGLPPDYGTVLAVPLVSGRIVKARVGTFNTEKAVGRGGKWSSVTEVYTDEI